MVQCDSFTRPNAATLEKVLSNQDPFGSNCSFPAGGCVVHGALEATYSFDGHEITLPFRQLDSSITGRCSCGWEATRATEMRLRYDWRLHSGADSEEETDWAS